MEGEFDLDSELIEEFTTSLDSSNTNLSFFSGAWSSEFVQLVEQQMASQPDDLTIVGAETIYSPAALRSFAETLMALLQGESGRKKTALVAAKKVYFGVGGSIADFCDSVRAKGGSVEQIREELDGVRRAVIEVKGAAMGA